MSPSSSTEIIDRIAVTIGNRVITESMIIQQVRLAAFYDNIAPDFSPASKREAAETLIDQLLLIQEMDDTRFTVPSMNEVIEYSKGVFGSRFPNDAAYQEELAARRLTADEVRQYLQLMVRALQFIELRFKRGQQIGPDEIAARYNGEFLKSWALKNPGKPPPPLEEVSDEVEEAIVAEKTDAATEEWLRQTRKTANIRIREEVFQ